MPSDKREWQAITLIESGTYSGSGNSVAYDLTEYGEVTVWLKVGLLEIGGSPPKYISWCAQVSDNNIDWVTHTVFDNITEANSIKLGKVNSNMARYFRIYYDIVGIPSANLEVTGIAKT